MTVIIPMKPLAQAKSRLRVPADIRSPRPIPAEFATAFLADVVRATATAQSVSRVLLTSSDLAIARFAQSHDVDFLFERAEPTMQDAPSSRLNAAASAAVSAAFDDDGCAYAAVLPGDLAALRSESVEGTLREATEVDSSTFVRDHTGIGTTLLCIARVNHIEPRYGGASGADHLRAGAVDITASASLDLRLDVDTWEDLATASQLGLGTHSQKLLADQAGLFR